MKRRPYVLRPWGRPIGLTIGCVSLSLLVGPISAGLGWGAPLGSGNFAVSTVAAAYSYFADNLLVLLANFALLWWWLTFVKYRSRTAFAIAGIVNSGYPLFLQFGKFMAFSDNVTQSDWLVVAGIVMAFSLSGALSMWLLHFAAYRRVDSGAGG